MIVVDTSALLAVAFDEPFRQACEAVLLGGEPLFMSAGTLTEALITSEGKGIGVEVVRLIDSLERQIIPVTEEAAHAALDAFRRYGKGRHPAGLNYGDCFSYAAAKHLDCPLLFVGDDFSRTDLRSALAS